MGENSFGKGLVQNFALLGEGRGLSITIARYYTPSGRSIQRDYTASSYYDYLRRGSLLPEDDVNDDSPFELSRAASAIDQKGGISPDDFVRPRLITFEQHALMDSVFFFARELVNGRVTGFESYKVPGRIDHGHLVRSSDFPVTETFLRAYEEYVRKQRVMRVSIKTLEGERVFLSQLLRFEITTAAYGITTAMQVLNVDDPQFVTAIEDVPRARLLIEGGMRPKSIR